MSDPTPIKPFNGKPVDSLQGTDISPVKAYMMTDISKQIDEILGELLHQFKFETPEGAMPKSYDHSKQEILALIHTREQQARIDELKRFDRSSEEMTKLIPLKIGERLYELTKQEEQTND